MIDRLYLDTSAIVKLVLNEPRSAETRALVAASQITATAAISRVEARAALARTPRLSEGSERGAALAALEQLLADLAYVEIADELIDRAGALAETYRLRGYDAVQLAAAMSFSVAEPAALLAWDRELIAAAVAEGLPVAV